MDFTLLPKSLGEITQAIVDGDNLNREYLVASALSAAASAIGTSEMLSVRGNWVTHPALFAVLVGRPGTGKTPPLNMMYKPLVTHDIQQHKEWKHEYTRWKSLGREERAETPAPLYRQTVLSDCTPESALTEHWKNQRGITIFNDEIIGFFKSMNRYASGSFLEQLLSAWSGTALKVTRKGEDMPMAIEDPCINMVGTIQPGRAPELLTESARDNGLIDRILFCYPEESKIPYWTFDTDGEAERAELSARAQQRWAEIINLLRQKPDIAGAPRRWSEEARQALCMKLNWEIEDINNKSDAEIDSRFAKRPTHLARLALVIQCIGEAAGDYPVRGLVDIAALECAIDIEDYCTDSLKRLEASEKPKRNDKCMTAEEALNKLPDEFTIEDFDALCPGIAKERQGRRWRKELIEDYKIVKISTDRFKKI